MNRTEYDWLQSALSKLKTEEKLSLLRLNRHEREIYSQAILAAKNTVSNLYHQYLWKADGETDDER